MALLLLLPNSRNNETSERFATPKTGEVFSPQSSLTSATPLPSTLAAEKPATTVHKRHSAISQTKSETQKKDTLPAPYDFVPADDSPFVDIKTLAGNVVYPEAAKKANLEGKVNVRVLVLPDGTASKKSFVEFTDAELFNPAALDAVHSATYTPAKQGGKPIACWVTVPIMFRLRERVGTKSVQKAQMLILSDEELSKIGIKSLDNGMIDIAGGGDGDHDFLRIQCDVFSRLHLVDLLKDSAFIHVGAPAFKQIFDFFPPEQVKRMKTAHAEFIIDKVTAKNSGLEFIPLPRLVASGKGSEQYYVNSKGFAGDRGLVKKFFENMVAQQSKSPEQAKKDSPQQQVQEDSAKKVMQSLLNFQQEKSDISKLIGIRIISKQARSEGDEYLLWYDPTPEFIALLPERYRVGLEREVEAAKKYATKCEIPTEEERNAVPGYFDSWRSCDGTLKITSIFPNPADVQATVRFTLQEPRSITITVHNLNGERLAILEPTPVLTAGEHELPLDFTGRNIGVYLLALSTDKNETAIKRVMIVR